jgi:hypothetical protein
MGGVDGLYARCHCWREFTEYVSFEAREWLIAIEQLAEHQRRIRNTCRFMLASTNDLSRNSLVPYDELTKVKDNMNKRT